MDLSERIDRIRDLDDRVFNEVIQHSFADLTKDVLKSEFPCTARALTMLVTKSNFVKNSIFDVSEHEDLYSANILYRSLIEHSLRHQYIFMSYAKNKNDSVGKDYYEYCDMGENLDFLKAIKSTNEIFDPENADIKTWEELSKIDERFQKCTPKQLSIKVDQFKYRSIIKFISSNLSLKEGILAKIIPLYSELSSFVHGGPYGEKNLFSHALNEQARLDKLENICEMTFEISKAIKSFTYLFAYQVNKKYGSYYNKINAISLDQEKN